MYDSKAMLVWAQMATTVNYHHYPRKLKLMTESMPKLMLKLILEVMPRLWLKLIFKQPNIILLQNVISNLMSNLMRYHRIL